MSTIIIDDGGEMRSQMREKMRRNYRYNSGNRMWDDGYRHDGRTYEDGYREGYKHGYEDGEEDSGGGGENYRRERDSRGRYM